MSQDFTMVLSGPHASPAEVLVDLEQRLSFLEFHRTFSVIQGGFDERRGVFDELDEDSASLQGPLEVRDSRDALPEWKALSTEFQGPTHSIYVLLGVTKPAFLNCYINISNRSLDKLFSQEAVHGFYAAVLAATLSTNATCGFGALELPFDPISPEKALAAIWNNPEYPGAPSWLGLISQALMSESDMMRNAAEHFEITSLAAGFWLLEHKEYLAFYR
jgi:hypothetical protein